MHWIWRPWRRMFDFSGRATRREYWLLQLELMIGYVAILVAIGALSDPGGDGAGLDTIGTIGFGLFVLFALFGWIATISAGVRRLHDHDKTGWLLLLSAVPLIGWIFLLIMTLTPGTPGENSYGYDPREGDAPSLDEVAAVFS